MVPTYSLDAESRRHSTPIFERAKTSPVSTWLKSEEGYVAPEHESLEFASFETGMTD